MLILSTSLFRTAPSISSPLSLSLLLYLYRSFPHLLFYLPFSSLSSFLFLTFLPLPHLRFSSECLDSIKIFSTSVLLTFFTFFHPTRSERNPGAAELTQRKLFSNHAHSTLILTQLPMYPTLFCFFHIKGSNVANNLRQIGFLHQVICNHSRFFNKNTLSLSISIYLSLYLFIYLPIYILHSHLTSI